MPGQKPQPKGNLSSSFSAPSLGDSKRVDSGLMRSTTGSLPPVASVALYATPSYGSLYTEPEDLEPGPGTYDLPDSIGYQPLSTNLSGQMSSITAKHQKAWSKTMITKDHLSAIMARGTPGPGTYIPRMVESDARVRIGTSKRGGLADTKFRAPGPVYEVRGNPDNPKQHTRFSKANRFAMDNISLSQALGSTGPGQYEDKSIFDGVRLSKSFGASHRAYDRVRFPGSEKEGQGRTSPGPGPLQPFQNSGKTNAFPRAERLPGDKAGRRAPGPGQYEVHNKPNPDMKTQSVYSFGRPSARGRMDFGRMKVLQSSSLWGMQ